MRKAQLLILILCSLVVFSCQNMSKYTSFTPGELWLDDNGVHINAHGGGILFDNGKYYWFGEHKTEGESGNMANVGVHCYSSTDLYNWKDEGIVLSVDEENSGSDIEKGCILERPKVIKNKKTGKYVMWFHLEPKGNGYKGALSGVAVSENVSGPYKFIKAVRPNAGCWPVDYPEYLKNKPSKAEGINFPGNYLPESPDSMNIVKRDFEKGQMARDMTLFVDEDGKAYHIYSSEENSTLHIALLSDDYLSHSGIYTRNFSGRFMEAPAIFKKDGKYYMMMSGCTGWDPNQARSAISDSILGQWTELGNPCINDTKETTFDSQSTFILPVQNKENTFIYMGDRWTPQNAIDGRYVWLPVEFENNKFEIMWQDKWAIK
ncbi:MULTISPECIES: glycoside hydrolase family 43 protein [Dysgonomonas]|uniref:glycoside hydrolase family 43 protein n=1 Tax=Dysgonomonas TaxID=156973 RepID=UPI0009262DC6|nr:MULTISPECIES: glycoside hydrolase family 43 protein [Dysgonomonas]MBN9300220.1 family 43 glycosylhydrolase [Dysgonomonas mossii]OJX59468.1 MAG: beta-glucanase [Dysgonomonas sp. 37-18]